MFLPPSFAEEKLLTFVNFLFYLMVKEPTVPGFICILFCFLHLVTVSWLKSLYLSCLTHQVTTMTTAAPHSVHAHGIQTIDLCQRSDALLLQGSKRVGCSVVTWFQVEKSWL
jgi:hypothetical protein